jgi:serine/threonine protein phosphatase PrpC
MAHVGMVRARNEDTLIMPGLMSAGSLPAPVTVRYDSGAGDLDFVVIDGMGGHHGGQEASRLIAQFLLDHPGPSVEDALAGANRAVYDAMGRSPSLTGMGATIAGVRVAGPEATIFNIGDARVYQFEAGYLMVVSTDDRRSSSSHMVTQSLGGTAQPTAVEPHVCRLTLEARARLLVCSDGLSEVVAFDAIRDTLGDGTTQTAAGILLKAVLAGGAPDNVSLIVLEFGADN